MGFTCVCQALNIPLADVATQAHVTVRVFNPEPTPDRLPKKGTGAPWGPVYGEILTFDDPEKPAFWPSTGWRGFTPAVPASTAAS